MNHDLASPEANEDEATLLAEIGDAALEAAAGLAAQANAFTIGVCTVLADCAS